MHAGHPKGYENGEDRPFLWLSPRQVDTTQMAGEVVAGRASLVEECVLVTQSCYVRAWGGSYL